MNKKRVLWLSNVDLLDKNPNKTGTWIHSMFHALRNSSEIDICANITFTSHSYFHKKEENGVIHFYVPRKESNSKDYPTKAAINYVVSAILESQPDLLHIWGLELYWGLIMGDERINNYKKLLEIQGIKSVCSENQYFMGGLSCRDIKKMRSFLQHLLPIRRVESIQSCFHNWGKAEKQILHNVTNINTQSDWVRNVLSAITGSSKLQMYKTGIVLRDSFTKSTPWYLVHKYQGHPVLFTTTSSIPYKGLHVTIKAFHIIKSMHPNAVLKIAGMNAWKPNLIRGGYSKYIYYLVKELGLQDSIFFLGNLNEKEMLNEMYGADVFVLSSYIESYCLALAEALSIGLPCVVAYSTALPELVKDKENGLLYPVGDHYTCACRIDYYLENPEFSNKVSETSSISYRTGHSSQSAVEMQMTTYKQLLSK